MTTVARLAKNEALYREVNERIGELMATQGLPAGERVDFLCECGDAARQTTVPLTLGEYREIHAERRRFCLVPGHEDLRLERVVAETDRFVVVEKRGEAGEIVDDRA